MIATLSTAAVPAIAVDLLLVPVFDGDPWRSPDAHALDARLRGGLRRAAAARQYGGAQGDELLLPTGGTLPARDVLLVGAGDPASPATWYRLADAAARAAKRTAARHLAVVLGAHASAQRVRAVSEGFALTRYAFTRFRSHAQPVPPCRLIIVVNRAAGLRPALADAAARADAVSWARDLVSTPAGDLPPTALAREARRLARRGIRVRVFDVPRLRRLGMGALLGVAQGSAQPPRFIELRYRPRGRIRRRVALVGKGITFDSGGLSIKNAQAMQAQKRDMAGGAVVLGVMSALPALRPAVEVRGYIPATENMPSGTAIKPGDVVRAFNGKTIEVLNTDAEGRLVLADALAYAATWRPDVMIDFATLTAAVLNALGNRYAAVMGTDPQLVSGLIAAGADVDERLWELPLVAEYRHDLESTVADLKNTGEGHAGTIIAGLFLREFVANVPWAHVDFSSTVMTEGHPCHPKGATGFGVRTVLEWLARL